MFAPGTQGARGADFDLAAHLRQGSFLVVDDYDSMRKVTINQLKQLGALKMLEAANGAEALKILSRQPITLILADWNMPVMNGLELLLSVRSDPKWYPLPFMMITAEAERDRVMLAIRAGVSELLVKPYTAGRFSERLERALRWKPRLDRPVDPEVVLAGSPFRVSGGAAPAASPPASATIPAHPSEETPVPDKPTILVVDDAPDNLTLLSHLFRDEYRVRIAHNGEKALRIAHSDTPPDLILLDIMMPGMDGFEVAQQLRAHPSSEHIPVIFVTAMTGEDARLKGMELGAVDFVTKPIDPDALRVRVRNFMRYVALHRQLQADYDGMMAAEALKEDVASITRHDLKAPLAGVIGILQDLAIAGNLSPEQRGMLHLAEETALQAVDMINLSNELYKIETGRFQLDPRPVPVAEIVRRVAELQRKVFAVRRITVAVATPHGLPDDGMVASGDPMLCYSLFQNLLKNACEAAPDGATVTARIVAEEAVTVTIENPGVVPAAIRERFFGKFVTAGKQGGTGLGTYSAKLLVEAQGGRIAMTTSDEENRTVVEVRLPKSGSFA